MSTPERKMYGFEHTVIAGKYRLDRYLAEGAFGAVYQATHIAYGVELRPVAVKLSKQWMEDAEACDKFRDALMLARLAEDAPDSETRDALVTIHDAGRCPEGGPLAGHPYVVMEYVGSSLAAELDRTPVFPLQRACSYFEQILRAIAFMHRGQEVLGGGRHVFFHRDLKPANVLVVRRPEGDRIKVTDFGLAVEVDTLLGWTESGGTLCYMALESFTRDICTAQSDVYALGLIFYEMVTGICPFAEVGSHLRGTDEAKREELRRLHRDARRQERFAFLEQHEELQRQPELARVIRTALQAEPEARRYRDACELLSAWQEALGWHRGRPARPAPDAHAAITAPACLPHAGAGAAGTPPPPSEPQWETARRLAEQAETCFAEGSDDEGERLLQQAMALNRSVPDSVMCGKAVLLAVRRLLPSGEWQAAWDLISEGHGRRPCRSTFTAMAEWYRAQGVAQPGLEADARECKDQE